jgi:hypothetical protein
LDPYAAWQDDSLYLSPSDLKKLPVNIPSGGWEAFLEEKGKEVRIPQPLNSNSGTGMIIRMVFAAIMLVFPGSLPQLQYRKNSPASVW